MVRNLVKDGVTWQKRRVGTNLVPGPRRLVQHKDVMLLK